MAIITPNSDLWLCRTKLSPDLKHSVKFATQAEQTTYFTVTSAVDRVGKDDYVFIGSQKDNYIRVGINADAIYDVNYIAYRNTTQANKIFYAFVKEIKWLSNNSSAIYFEIDPWQTWQFDITFNPSFIVREHTPSDIPGENVLDEGLDIGDYVQRSTRGLGLNELCIVVATSTIEIPFEGLFGYNVTPKPGTVYYNTYSGSCLIWFEMTQAGVDLLNGLLTNLTSKGKEDAITSIYMAPKKLMKARTIPSQLTGTEVDPWLGNYVGRIVAPPLYNTFDGYTAKNAKLFTFPYTSLTAYNNLGDSYDYPLEYFWWESATPIHFEVYGTANGSPELVLVPKNYKERVYNFSETVEIKGYPMVSWQYDAFKGWLAKQASGQLLQTVGSIGAVAVGAVTANPLAIGGGVMGLLSSINQTGQAMMRPRDVKGSQGSNNSIIAAGFADFFIAWKMIRGEYAQIIDKYFSMYGYKVNRVGTPNFNARPKFYYCQMNDVNITGFVPPDDLLRIKKMFIEGTTIWKQPNDVMNYSLMDDNSIMLSPITLTPQTEEPYNPLYDLSSFTGGTSEGGGGNGGGGIF